MVLLGLILAAPPSSREGLLPALQLHGAQVHAGSFSQTVLLRTLDIAIVILSLACNKLRATSFLTTHTLRTTGSAYLYGPRDRTACTGANPVHSPAQLRHHSKLPGLVSHREWPLLWQPAGRCSTPSPAPSYVCILGPLLVPAVIGHVPRETASESGRQEVSVGVLSGMTA